MVHSQNAMYVVVLRVTTGALNGEMSAVRLPGPKKLDGTEVLIEHCLHIPSGGSIFACRWQKTDRWDRNDWIGYCMWFSLTILVHQLSPTAGLGHAGRCCPRISPSLALKPVPIF